MTPGEQNIRVVVRVRPSGVSAQQLLITENTIHWQASTGVSKRFTFDKAIGANVSQEELFTDVGIPTVDVVVEGYNGTILAYGQTGSGKTHTMLGPQGGGVNFLDENHPCYDERGLIPRIGHYLFTQLNHIQGVWTLEASFYEIYQEKVRDLLDPSGKQLQVMGDKSNVRIMGLSTTPLMLPKQLLQLLRSGAKQRIKRATDINEYSSRSHAILQLTVTQKLRDGRELKSKLNLVDLAGSERQSKTKASGLTAQEAVTINLSLSTLGQVIRQLCQSHEHISFRNSILTRVLQDSLGGNHVTTLVCTISPDLDSMNETISTLTFANHAKQVKNHSVQNVVLSAAELQVRLNASLAEIARLKRELQNNKKREKDAMSHSLQGKSASALMLGTGPVFQTSREVSLLQDVGERDAKELALRSELAEAETRLNERDVEIARLQEEVGFWRSQAEVADESAQRCKAKYDEERKLVLDLRAANDALMSSLEAAKKAQTESMLQFTSAMTSYGTKLNELRLQNEADNISTNKESQWKGKVMELEAMVNAGKIQLEEALELKSQELSACQQQITALQRTIEEQHSTLGSQSAAISAARQKHQGLESNVQDLRQERDRYQATTHEMKKEISQLKNEVDGLQFKVKYAAQESAALRAQVSELEETAAAAEEKVMGMEHLNEQLRMAQSAVEEREGQDHDQKQHISTLRDQLQQAHNQIETLLTKEMELGRKLHEQEANAKSFDKIRCELEHKQVALKRRNEIFDQRNDELERENSSLAQKLQDAESVQRTTQQAQVAEIQLLVDEKQKLQAQLDETKQQLHQLHIATAAQVGDQVAQARNEMAQQRVQAQARICDLWREITELQEKEKRLTEDAAHGWLLVKEKEKQAEDLEVMTETLSEELDRMKLKAEGFRTLLLQKDAELTGLREALQHTLKLVKVSRSVTAEERMAILNAGQESLTDLESPLEALANKLYSEEAQGKFVASVEEELQSCNEEMMDRQRDHEYIMSRYGAGGDPNDPALVEAAIENCDFWDVLDTRLHKIVGLLNRAQFISADHENARISLLEFAELMLEDIQVFSAQVGPLAKGEHPPMPPLMSPDDENVDNGFLLESDSEQYIEDLVPPWTP